MRTFIFKITLTLALSFSAAAPVMAQGRFNAEDVDKPREQPEARPGLGIKRTSRFSMMEQNQRFGVQQVGEAMADAVSQPLLKRTTSQPEQFANQAATLVKEGKFERAVELYNKALKLQPNSLPARQGLGYALIQMGDFNAAALEFQQAIEREPNNSESQLNLGVAYYRSGKINEAISQYQRAIGQKEQFPAAHFNIAMAYAHSGDFTKAINHYNIAITQRNKSYPEAYNNLGLVYEVMGDLAAASEHFQLAIKQRNGRYPLAHYNMARVYQFQIKYDQAIASLQLAIKQQPDYAEAYLNLGNIYLVDASLAEITRNADVNRNQKLGQAIEAYRKALDLREGFYPLAHEGMAIALTMFGKSAEAYAEYRLAFDQNRGYCPATLQNLILALNGSERFSTYTELSLPANAGNLANKKKTEAQQTTLNYLEEQLKEYEDLEDKVKDNADVRYCAGLTYVVTGNYRSAFDEFSRAVALSGGKDEQAQKALNELTSLLIH